MCQVSWSLEVKRPWRSKVLPRNDLVCLGMFHWVLLFRLDEIHVRGARLVYGHGDVQENIPKDQPRAFEEGPKSWSQDCPRQPQTTETSTARGPIDASLMGAVGKDIVYGERRPFSSLWSNQRKDILVRLWTNGPSTAKRLWGHSLEKRRMKGKDLS